MAKDTLWFPHDYNARADEKTAALINDHSASGYGIFQIITEILHEEDDSRIQYEEKKLRRLAATCKTDYNIFKSVIDDCINIYELWTLEEGYFFSNRVIKNKEAREHIRNKRREAGQKGGEANALKFKANASENSSIAKANGRQNEANSSTGQDNTVIPSKEAIISPYGDIFTDDQKKRFEEFQKWIAKDLPEVSKMKKPFTIDEYLKLKGEHPKTKTTAISKEELVNTLRSIENNTTYLKKYRSPYLCILNWSKNQK
jgi:hypothetical protein